MNFEDIRVVEMDFGVKFGDTTLNSDDTIIDQILVLNL
jgi:hypothetical protein